jgi:cytosine/adenosine deaminase-related metal-dependent hydrolase
VILRARIVMPMSGPPIEDGAVVLKGERIVRVGKWKDVRGIGTTEDLGEVVLLPGLVNAHCHLDYTDIRIDRGRKSFTQWVKAIISRKIKTSIGEYFVAWIRGAQMLAHSGTTTVADIEAVSELLPWVWESTPLRVVSFLEITGVQSGIDPEKVLKGAFEKLSQLKSANGSVGLSPHALYSTVPKLLKLTAKRGRKLSVAVHVAESEDELDMYARRRGPLFDWLKNFRDMSDCGGTTPVEAVHRAGLLGKNFLAVHANYLKSKDVRLLAESGASVAHCPSSHEYFGHRRFPFEKLDRAGINICLGTDSMASMRGRELNMFTEMQQFAKVYPKVAPVQILRMATSNGAAAIGLKGKVGELRAGSFADLIAVPFTGKTSQAASAVLYTKRIGECFINGQNGSLSNTMTDLS